MTWLLQCGRSRWTAEGGVLDQNGTNYCWMLQFGRGRVTAEGRIKASSRIAFCSLQCGRGRVTAEGEKQTQDSPSEPAELPSARGLMAGRLTPICALFRSAAIT